MIVQKDGDLLKSGLPVIAHQTNCLGVMGAGIAKQIKRMAPGVYYEYRKLCFSKEDKHTLLGQLQVCSYGEPVKYIANLFGEYSYAEAVAPFEGNRHTDYDALKNSLIALKNWLIQMNITEVGIPYKLGCGLAGGDWDGVVYPMIQDIFENNQDDITLYIYKL